MVERTRVLEIKPLSRRVAFTETDWSCDRCDESLTDDDQGDANARARLDAETSALAVPVVGDDLVALRRDAGMTQSALETLLGTGVGTVPRWETDARAIPPYIAATVRMLASSPGLLRRMREVQERSLDVGTRPKLRRSTATARPVFDQRAPVRAAAGASNPPRAREAVASMKSKRAAR